MKKVKEFIGKVIAWFDKEWKRLAAALLVGIIIGLIL